MESVGKRPKASPPCIGVLGALRRIGALVLQARWCCRHVGAAGALAHWCIECIGAHWCISASHAFGPPPAVAAEAVVQQMRQLRVAVGHSYSVAADRSEPARSISHSFECSVAPVALPPGLEIDSSHTSGCASWSTSIVCEREERELTLVPATCRTWLPAAIAVKTCCGDETSQYCRPST
eukprot:scaffold48381_cov62-Phaeocystis_antarctica.AAC.13